MSCSTCSSTLVVAPLVPTIAPVLPLAGYVAPVVPYVAPVNLTPYMVAPSIASSWAIFQAALNLEAPVTLTPILSTPCCGGSSPVLYRVK